MLLAKEPYPPLTRPPFPMHGGGFAAFFIGRCPKVVFKSRVTSHKSLHNTKEGISLHVWHEILRLSPRLFWLGLFSHRAFLSAQDDDTGERVVSRGGGLAAFLLEDEVVN